MKRSALSVESALAWNGVHDEVDCGMEAIGVGECANAVGTLRATLVYLMCWMEGTALIPAWAWPIFKEPIDSFSAYYAEGIHVSRTMTA